MSLPTIGTPKNYVSERTIAGTAAKNEKRMAHIPKKEFLRCPTIVADLGNKIITTVVRGRYVKLIAEEYIKNGISECMAAKMAAEEEGSLYQNCTSKFGYLNKAIHVIKRLRSVNPQEKPEKIPPSVPETQKHEQHLTGRELYNKLKAYILTEKDLQENHFPRPDCPGKAKFYLSDIAKDPYLPSDERFCIRCAKSYRVNSYGKSVVEDECMYHWAKPVRKRYGNSVENRYRCCQGEPGSTGCEVAPLHVHHKNKYDGTSGYMTTSHNSMSDGYPQVYAMDCEMVYTTAGMEVARVTLINSECDVVYETFVKPAHEILDYNTRYSGIQESDMKNVERNLIQVQAVLLHYISADTILVGHSLESDLMSVKIVHSNVVDTSVLYPHRLGKPLKRGLKALAQDYLNMTIQDSSNGHDSKEDAIAAMKLVHHRLQQDTTKKYSARCDS